MKPCAFQPARIWSLRHSLRAAVILAVFLPSAACGQAVDYGTLEQMFGEPITTSATGKPQRVSEVPADIVIITQDDIRRSGATDIPDILQFVIGIDVRRYSFGDAQVGIRGYDTPLNPRLLVLVDGRQVYMDDYGYVAWNAIPVQLDEIRQIEVVKGPASALFGFNAASGVVNIVTYDPLLDNVNTATVRGGTQGFGGGDGVATMHMGPTVGLRMSVGGWTATGFENQAGVTDPISSRYGSVNLDARWQVSPNILLRAEAGTTDAGTPRVLVTTAADLEDRIDFWRIGAASDTSLGVFDVDFYRNRMINDFNSGGYLSNTNAVLVGKISDIIKPDADNTVRFALEYRSNSLAFEDPAEGTLSYDNYAASAMWDWRMTPWADFNNAVRIDHLVLHDTGAFLPTPGRSLDQYNSTTITATSFNSGAVFMVSGNDTIRLTAARGLQLPSLFDFGIQIPLGPINFVGSPNVVPTSVWNAELAYDRRIDMLDATLRTALFWQRNTTMLAGPDTGGIIIVEGHPELESENVGSSYELGIEVGLRGKTEGGLRWNLSYRYATIHDDITASVANLPLAIGSYDSGTPANEFIAGAGYTIGRWELDLQGRYQSRYLDYAGPLFGAVPFTVNDFVTLNARIGLEVTRYLTIAGTAEQFAVPRIVESSGDYVNRQFIASANLRF
jgi:outer membrane receptor for ferrienterochelin and colicins